MTFEEEFPGLWAGTQDTNKRTYFFPDTLKPKGSPLWLFYDSAIQEHCLDKERVREAFDVAYEYAEGNNGLCDCAEEAMSYFRRKFEEELRL